MEIKPTLHIKLTAPTCPICGTVEVKKNRTVSITARYTCYTEYWECEKGHLFVREYNNRVGEGSERVRSI